MIIDSSAILAIFFRESGAEELLSAIIDADFAGIDTPTAVETGLVLTARLNQNATGSILRFFQETGIEIVPFDDLHWQRAVDAFARFGKGRHPAALNFGDCMTYATAVLSGQPFLPWRRLPENRSRAGLGFSGVPQCAARTAYGTLSTAGR